MRCMESRTRLEEHSDRKYEFKPCTTLDVEENTTFASDSTAKELLQPQVVDNTHEKILLKRQESKLYYDKQAKELPKLESG